MPGRKGVGIPHVHHEGAFAEQHVQPVGMQVGRTVESAEQSGPFAVDPLHFARNISAAPVAPPG